MSVAGYKADLVLFPELFNAPLLSQFDQQDPPEAMRSLAEYTDQLRDEMLRMSVRYNINIVAGSLPHHENDQLYKGLGKKYIHHLACPLARLLRCTRQHISTNMHWRMRLVYEPNYGANW